MQQSGGCTAITYFAQSVTVKVYVTDEDMDGWMEFAVTYDGAQELTITNKYAAGATKLALTGTKKVDTRDPRDGEFEFMLTAVNGAPMPRLVDTEHARNDDSGNILFPEITYKAVSELCYRYRWFRPALCISACYAVWIKTLRNSSAIVFVNRGIFCTIVHKKLIFFRCCGCYYKKKKTGCRGNERR